MKIVLFSTYIAFRNYRGAPAVNILLLLAGLLFAIALWTVFGASVCRTPAAVDAVGNLGILLMAVVGGSIYPISSLLKTPAQMQAAAPVFALLTGFSGGCFRDFITITEKLEKLSMNTLQGWALKAVNSLLTDLPDFGGIALPNSVLLFISLILMPISYMIILKYPKN